MTAVLYGPLGAACTADLNAVLRTASASGTIQYALRPVMMSHCQVGIIGRG